MPDVTTLARSIPTEKKWWWRHHLLRGGDPNYIPPPPSIPRWPNGLDKRYWDQILLGDRPVDVVEGNLLTSVAPLTQGGSRRIIDGQAHVQPGWHLNMGAAAGITPIAPFPQLILYGSDDDYPIGGIFVLQAPNAWEYAGGFSYNIASSTSISLGVNAALQQFDIYRNIGGTVRQHQVDFPTPVSPGQWCVAAFEVRSRTTAKCWLNGVPTDVQTMDQLDGVNPIESVFLGHLRISGDLGSLTQGLSTSLFYHGYQMTDEEMAALHDTLFYNIGGPLELPKPPTRLFLCDQGLGVSLIDSANKLEDQTAAAIQNYTAGVWAQSTETPKANANDEGVTEARFTSGNADSGRVAPDLMDTGTPGIVSEVAYIQDTVSGGSSAVTFGLLGGLGTGRRHAYSISQTENITAYMDGSSTTFALSRPHVSGELRRVRWIRLNNGNMQLDVDYGDGVWNTENEFIFSAVGNEYDFPPSLCSAKSDDGNYLSSNARNLVIYQRYRRRDGTYFDTRVDGWGTPEGPDPPRLALLPTNQNDKPNTVRGDAPEFPGPAPRDIRLEGNNAYSFDGTQNLVTDRVLTELTASSRVSASFWLNMTSGAARIVLSDTDTGNNYIGTTIQVAGGRVYFGLINTVGTDELTVYTQGVFNDGVDHFVEVSYDGSKLASGVEIKVDGHVDPLTTSVENLTSENVSSGRPLEIGSRTGANKFNGLLWEVKLDINGQPVVHVPISEGNGSVMHDIVRGTAYPIVNHLAVRWAKANNQVARNAAEGFSFARDFNGVDRSVDIGRKIFSQATDFEITCYASWTDGGTRYLVSEYGTTNPTRPFYLQVGTGVRLVLDNGAVNIVAAGVYNDGQVHKIHAKRVGSAVTLTVDDTDQVTATYGLTLQNSDVNTLIGQLAGIGFFSGTLRHVKVTVGQAVHQWNLDESPREIVAVDSIGDAHGEYVGFAGDETDVLRIPARTSSLDAWGLPLSNLGLRHRGDGNTHNEAEHVERWSGLTYEGQEPNAPYASESQGHVYVNGGQNQQLVMPVSVVPSSDSRLQFSCDFRSSATPSGLEYFFSVYIGGTINLIFAWNGQTSGVPTLEVYDGSWKSFGNHGKNDGLWHNLGLTIDWKQLKARAFIDGEQFGSDLSILTKDLSTASAFYLLGNDLGSAVPVGDLRHTQLLVDGEKTIEIPFGGDAHNYGSGGQATNDLSDLVWPLGLAPTARAYEPANALQNSNWISRSAAGWKNSDASNTYDGDGLGVNAPGAVTIIGQDNSGFAIGDLIEYEFEIEATGGSGSLRVYFGSSSASADGKDFAWTSGVYRGRNVISNAASPGYFGFQALSPGTITGKIKNCLFRKVSPDAIVPMPGHVNNSEPSELEKFWLTRRNP